MRYFLLIGLLVGWLSGSPLDSQAAVTPWYTVKVIKSFPHDRDAFTQGLEFVGNTLYESTGLVGRSFIRKVDLETGKVLQEVRLSAPFFGEGITVLKGQMVQLTWQNNVGIVYQLPEFKMVRQFTYPGEGWGLTNDGKQIYMSDGTPEIRVWEAGTLKELRRITVHDGPRRIAELNELEFVNGEIFANVWQTDKIVRISPLDGRVLGWIDLASISAERAGGDVLNGIAYDAAKKRLIVTGKLWPKMFQIELVKK